MKYTALATALIAIAGAAHAETTLNVYNWSDYIAEDTLEKFTKETGIKVNYDMFDSNEVLEGKLLGGNTGYDVVVPSASFLQRQVQAGVFQKLDTAKLPNLKNMDADVMSAAAKYDANNDHSVIYMWGTTGLGYNTAMVEKALGADAPTDSWALVFDPQYADKLKDCGISVLDAPTELLPSAMAYLGLDPTSTDKADFEKAAELLKTAAKNFRYFHSSQYINDLANGDICVSVGWSGDVFLAMGSAEEAENGVELDYSIPKEGALQWFDLMAIPADAPNPEAAHTFINFIMDAQITADITNYVWYANGNKASMPMVEEEIKANKSIFPDESVRAKLFPSVVYGKKTDRVITRLWTSIKTGQ